MEKLSLNESSPYWGDYGDLYQTLNASEIESLENSSLHFQINLR